MSTWSLGSGFSGDNVFLSMVTALPAPLSDAMDERGLADPGLLASYPHTDFRQLGLLLVEYGVGDSSSTSILPCFSSTLASGTDGLLRGSVQFLQYSSCSDAARTGFDPQLVSLNSTSFVATDISNRVNDADISTSGGGADVDAGVSQISSTVNFYTFSRANPSCEELVHAQFHPSSSSEQFPLGPDATSPTSAHTEQHISRTSNTSTTTAPSRRAHKKASNDPPLIHTGPATCVSSLETIHEVSAALESSIRLSGLHKNEKSHVSLTSVSVEQVLMDPGYEAVSGAVQNPLMDVGIAKVSVASELMDVRHETSYGVVTSCPPKDEVVLYHTLVQDGALPSGYEAHFAELGPYIFPEADRQLRQLARLDNVSASVALHHFEKERTQLERVEKKGVEQFLAAALNKPKVYKTRLQKPFYETATARRDTEEAERVRWASELCTLFRGTNTPVEKLLVEKPSSESLVGAGKRAATLRSRVRMAR